MIRAPDLLHRYSAGWFAVISHRGALQTLSHASATAPSLRKKVLVLAGRLRRLFNAWAAASIAHHAASAVQHARDHPPTRGIASGAQQRRDVRQAPP